MKKIPIVAAGFWIAFFEFVRNEFLFKNYWINHYSELGMVFETLPINGFLWFSWSIFLAFLIYKLSEKFPPKETIALSWMAAFPMMWIVIFNLQVLPIPLLLFAIPLSLAEITIAFFIMARLK